MGEDAEEAEWKRREGSWVLRELVEVCAVFVNAVFRDQAVADQCVRLTESGYSCDI